MTARQDTPLMTGAEVGVAFRVDSKTVTRWAQAGKLSCIKTPGGWRRFHRAEVAALLSGEPLTPAQVGAMWAAHRNGGAQ